MFNTPMLSNRLCVKDGVIAMQDGSDLQAYLRSREAVANANEVVILTRSAAQALVEMPMPISVVNGLRVMTVFV